jgi:hypothetical protein
MHPPPSSGPGTGKLAAVLAFFFVAGAAMALVIWHTLSEFLAGKPVEGGVYLLAMAFIGVFVGFAWLLGRFIHSSFPPSQP